MRLTSGKSDSENKEIAEFSRWILEVGNGTLPNVHPDETIHDPDIVIPDKFLIKSEKNPIKHVVGIIYPDIAENIKNPDFVKERSILTPTNPVVSDINSYILDYIPGTTHTYYSQDSLSDNFSQGNDFFKTRFI